MRNACYHFPSPPRALTHLDRWRESDLGVGAPCRAVPRRGRPPAVHTLSRATLAALRAALRAAHAERYPQSPRRVCVRLLDGVFRYHSFKPECISPARQSRPARARFGGPQSHQHVHTHAHSHTHPHRVNVLPTCEDRYADLGPGRPAWRSIAKCCCCAGH